MYIKGLSETVYPDNDHLDDLLEHRYGFSDLTWAGPGSTIVKRSADGACRGYAFVSFLTPEGAAQAVVQINEYAVIDQHRVLPTIDTVDGDESSQQLPVSISAALCTSKPKKKKEQKSATSQQHKSSDYTRFRRQRGAPVRKHPVIRSSDGTRTGLGNKTK